MAHWKKRETVFAEYGFQMTLPGGWQVRPCSQPDQWVYRGTDRQESITIRRDDPLIGRNNAEQNQLLERIVARDRRSNELRLAKTGALELSDPEYGEWAGVRAGWYSASTGEKGGFHSLIICPKSAVWTVLYEDIKLTPEETQERMREIFDSIAFQK
jgi:hypothetical protein